MFDKQRSLIKVQGGRSYLPVAARLVWFREVHADWGIETQAVEINHEQQYAVFRAIVRDAEGRTIATATKKEDVKGFGDYLEKAETGAVGRALGMAGFGTDSDPDMDDGKNGDAAHIVDAPQSSRGPVTTPSSRFTDRGQTNSRVADAPRKEATWTDRDDAPARAPRPVANNGANIEANMDENPFHAQ